MPPKFSAAESMMGYLYQCRSALLLAVERLRDGEPVLMRLETADDVVFDTNGASAQELIQTKHHVRRTARLTDASPDLWKTIRVWCSALAEGYADGQSLFVLITTSTAPDGSAAALLRAGSSRDEERAREKLVATAESSNSMENRTAYEEFKSLAATDQKAFLQQIVVCDREPNLIELDDELKKALFFAADSDHLDSFLTRLEGWWLRRVIKDLTDPESTPILSEEIEAELGRLREQFKEDSLPVDDDLLTAEIPATGFEDKTFVAQLRLIELGNKRILLAIRDYFRAFEQRSRWIREDLVLVGELDRYENRLFEEWELLFERMRDELGDEEAEDRQIEATQSLYEWVETGSHPRIRPNVEHPSISRGSLHMLSDQERVGWHPHWQRLLERLRANRRQDEFLAE